MNGTVITKTVIKGVNLLYNYITTEEYTTI